MTQAPPPDTTRLGYCLGPQGLKGAVKIYVLGDLEQLLALGRVWVEGRGWLKIRQAEPLFPGVALHLAGVLTREQAADLRGAQVYAADAELPALEEGRYYYHQLRGLPVQDAQGAQEWEVEDVQDMGYQDLLVLRRRGGGETFFVPLQAPYVHIASDEAGVPAGVTLTEETPEGLLDYGLDMPDGPDLDGPDEP
ncbi:ribosome maturation factor RimM [Deinococcus lacus]|uniref:Ribosome maturation factor RimM n=1 Tax=Deinococcus lacus TaxID=392561 RepID=A0ABW1YBD5_9DEIO